MTNTTMEDFSPKMFNKDASPQQTSASSSGCFDCNICLDFAVDPVVTLCGHLYCWPCIYKWLQMEDRISPQSCPVCKATLSEHSLVPLYGRGTPAKRHHHQTVAIPHRPSVRQHHHHLHLHDHSHEGELSSSSLLPRMMSSAPAVGLLGEMVVAVLPWAFRNNQAGAAAMAGGLYYPNLYQQAGGGTPRLRRQEMQVERWLNQMWMFLFCCAILCLLWF